MPPNIFGSTQSKNRKQLPVLVGSLAVVLGVLFFRSFDPNLVAFSNDGPLGAVVANSAQMPDTLAGYWQDLNSFGSNGGISTLNLTSFILWGFGPLFFSKFYVPVVLGILGLCAWFFFRQLRLAPVAAILGALAAVLNSTFFSDACWGVGPHEIALAMDFLALGLVVSDTPETRPSIRWTRLALAGLCVGVNVTEGADMGAIYSILVAAFVFFKSVADTQGTVVGKITSGVVRVAVVSVFAGFIAFQTVVGLIGVEIHGVAGTAQDTETKAAHWDWATQWSEPKKETLGLFIPGLFGYRMDTPKDMMPSFQDAYKGGNYWGGVGRDPAIDRFFDSGQTGSPPSGFMRFGAGDNYCGILVALVTFWAVAQSLRRRDSVFTETQRRYIWFWAAVAFLCLLFSWGRFAPFYALLYKLPYFSTIRNPTKYLVYMSWAVVILFGYGVHGLSRRYLEVPAGKSGSLSSWWAKAGGFDRKWVFACAAGIGLSVLGWLIYASEKSSLVRYLQTVGFGDKDTATEMAAFSISQVGWFILFFVVAAGLFLLVLAGVFSGKRARLGGILLGLFLVIDLVRADLPFVIHWDYKQKYEVGSLNPLETFLKDKPYEHRVAYGLPRPLETPGQFGLFGDLYNIEWTQHHFLYYNIQSLDIIQMSRMPADLAAYNGTFQIGIKQDASGKLMIAPETFPRVTRLWELTDTRYLLGPAALLDLFNGQFDPEQHRFRIVQHFDVVAKPGIAQPTRLEELTAVANDTGPYALIEFTGALPRAKLYSNWETNSSAALNGFTTNGLSDGELKTLESVGTNDFLTLKKLVSPSFDPQQTVLLSAPLPAAPSTNQNSGTVEFKSYAPKKIIFDANATAPSVLLLNDKYDPGWRVTLDGQPAELLRCNFIMRGVYLAPGDHTVEFNFTLPNRLLYVTLAAIATGVLLCGLLFFLGRKPAAAGRA